MRRHRWGPPALIALAACSATELPPETETAIQGTRTATTARWSPMLAEAADWRAVGSDRLLAAAQPLLRYRSPGRPTLYAFWATYCPPCFAELPLLKTVHKEGRVAVVSVSLDADQTRLAATALAHHQVRHRSVVLTKQSLPRIGALLPAGLPFALVLDRRGQVVAHHAGQLTAAHMARLLRAAGS